MLPPQAPLASPDDVEAQFYEALQQGDIEKMMAVWAEDEEVVCVHPGGQRVIGAGAIRATFDAMFAQGAVAAFPEQVRRVQTVSSAVHSVLERVALPGPRGEMQTAWTLATNVYVKTPQGWRLVCHHASPGSSHELAEITEMPALLH